MQAETVRWVEVQCPCGKTHKVRIKAIAWYEERAGEKHEGYEYEKELDFGVNIETEVLSPNPIAPPEGTVSLEFIPKDISALPSDELAATED